MIATLHSRSEFQRLHLPNLLKSLVEVNDECGVALQYHLSKYGFHYEQALTADAQALCPALAPASVSAPSRCPSKLGIRKIFEDIDHIGDLQNAINSAIASNTSNAAFDGSDPKNRAAAPTLGLASLSLIGPPVKPVFGIPLTQLAERDNTDVPLVISKITSAIEEQGLDTVGIYRVSGSSSSIHRLRAACDRGPLESLCD